jgi:signal peptidase I
MTRWLFALLATVGLALGAFLLLTATGELNSYRMPTGSMKPTLQPGDHFYSERISYHFRKPRRGDIVVFSTVGIGGIPQPESGKPSPLYIERVIGLPGDTLEMHFGDLLVNGKTEPALAGRKIVPGRSYLNADGTPVHVPTDSYFVAGDNSPNSFDSRYWGFLPAENLKGRALLRYWPLSRFGFL